MDAIEAIMTRRSIRKFKDLPVDWEKVGIILEAGQNAPSAGNLQNWKFIVVLDEDKRKAVAEICLEQYWMQNAAVHIIIVSEIQKTRQFYGVRGERLYAVQNCAAAAQNMLIASHALGLGACWIGSFDEEKLRKLCNIPEYVRAEAVIAVGVPDEKPQEPAKYTLWDIVHLGNWESKIKDVKWVMKDHAWSVQDRLAKQGKKIEKTVEKAKNQLHGKLRQTIEETTQTILDKLKGKR